MKNKLKQNNPSDQLIAITGALRGIASNMQEGIETSKVPESLNFFADALEEIARHVQGVDWENNTK